MPLALKSIFTNKNYVLKLLLLTLIILIIYMIFFYPDDSNYYYNKDLDYELNTHYKNHEPLELKYVIVHLDLKGAPPKLAYLKSLLPILKENGANGLLIEYEDMFPYENELKHIHSKHCYKRDELGDFLRTATEEGFEIIPLVQTFAHMEYVLKLKEFADLREEPTNVKLICPTQNKSQQLLKAMLFQVLKFHIQYSNISYIHIGCDEVVRNNTCDFCFLTKLNKDEIYLNHVINLSNTIKDMYPHMTVLIWDDIIRRFNAYILDLYNVSRYIEPVLWNYTPDLNSVSNTLYHYGWLLNKSIWVASAFKGADGATAILPNLKSRCANTRSWMNLLKRIDYKKDLNGIFLTGWSRYSHFSELCELLPSSIHSLIFNLLIINEFRTQIIYPDDGDKMTPYSYAENKFKTKLICICDIRVNNFQNYCCDYKELRLYALLNRYKSKEAMFNKICSLSILSDSLKTKNVYRDDLIIRNGYKIFNKCIKTLTDVELDLSNELKLYFDEHVIKEYIFKITKKKRELLENFKSLEKYYNMSL